MKLQILVIFLVGVVLVSGAELSRANNNSTATTRAIKTRQFHRQWYGPSFQPEGWKPDVSTRSDNHFGYYPPDGAETWPDHFAECGGDRQSPINLNGSQLIHKITRNPLTFLNYDADPYTLKVQNSGHSIHCSGEWDSFEVPTITGGPLQDKFYEFSQLHFHWGENDNYGSEHTINGKIFSAEMHVVHAKKDQEEVSNDPFQPLPDDIAVVGIMLKAGKHNEALQSILNTCSRIGKEANSEARIRPFPLNRLVKPFNSDYATYEGSLTTPPCSENVSWIVSSNPIYCSREQLQQLRTCIGLRFNYRPRQRTNDRSLYYLTSHRRNHFEK